MRTGGTIRIGCSGWQYRHWRGNFYPPELPKARWFAHYALHFDTVEINNSFYRLPEAATFGKWSEQAPRRFIYAVKASRFLTHSLVRFFDHAKHLGAHLGPTLYQLPPQWPLDLERFEIFVRALQDVWPYPVHVVEFRAPSWRLAPSPTFAFTVARRNTAGPTTTEGWRSGATG